MGKKTHIFSSFSAPISPFALCILVSQLWRWLSQSNAPPPTPSRGITLRQPTSKVSKPQCTEQRGNGAENEENCGVIFFIPTDLT